MKILQINASYKPAFIYGGPTMSVSKLSEVLVREGINLEVITTRANGAEELEVPLNRPITVDGVRVTYYKRLTKDHTHFSAGLYWGLIGKIVESRKRKVERLEEKAESLKQKAGKDLLVHIHTWWNLVSVVSCLIAVLYRTPVVLSPRGTLSQYSFGNKNSLIKRLIFKLSLPLFKRCHFHVTSENEKRAILNISKPRSIHVIPNLVNLPLAESTLSEIHDKYSDQGLSLLFLSRIEHKKGLSLLFSALSKLTFPFHLSIAGTGDEWYVDSLKKETEKLGITASLIWLGHQNDDQKFSLMGKFDLLVLPSYDENFANVVIESLAMGTPVLVTENVGLSDYVYSKKLGWVCQTDPESIADKLQEIAENPDELKRIKGIAASVVREDFSDSKVGKQYIAMYEQILSQHSL